MVKISERLEKVETAMKDPAKNTPLGNLLKNTAIAAIMNGIGSPQWTRYMSMFADNQEQLDRLTISDEENDAGWLRESRAYIVSNAVCAAATNTQTKNGVETAQLDDGVATNAETAVADLRPAAFKNLVS